MGDLQQRELAQAQVALDEKQAFEAEAELLQYRIDQSKISAPFDAIVLRGELFDKPGLPVKQGEVMFEIAKADPENEGRSAVEMEALVSERDIQEVKRVWDLQHKGQMERRAMDGELATSSYPNEDFP